jgi:BMFP domain-containing protein YqiC
MINRTAWFEDLQKNISDLIARSPAADIERNVKGMMGQAFSKLDLVTREEFDIQTELLARTRIKVDALELQVKAMEARLAALESTASAPAPSAGTSTGSSAGMPPASTPL